MFIAWFLPADSPLITRTVIKTRYAFVLPVKVLSRVFRGKFVAALKRAFRDGSCDSMEM